VPISHRQTQAQAVLHDGRHCCGKPAAAVITSSPAEDAVAKLWYVSVLMATRLADEPELTRMASEVRNTRQSWIQTLRLPAGREPESREASTRLPSRARQRPYPHTARVSFRRRTRAAVFDPVQSLYELQDLFSNLFFFRRHLSACPPYTGRSVPCRTTAYPPDLYSRYQATSRSLLPQPSDRVQPSR